MSDVPAHRAQAQVSRAGVRCSCPKCRPWEGREGCSTHSLASASPSSKWGHMRVTLAVTGELLALGRVWKPSSRSRPGVSGEGVGAGETRPRQGFRTTPARGALTTMEHLPSVSG